MQRVMVTGGAGFLGRHLVDRLLAQGVAQVQVLALPHERVPAHWDHRVRVLRGDVTDPACVAEATVGCEVVFHLAALVGDGASYADHERVTVGGTVCVFDAARRHRARVVLTTSICAYGDAIQRGPCPEDTVPGRFQGPYSRAKQMQERCAWAFRDAGGEVVVVRPANIIGPGCGPWVTDACQALRQKLPALIGGGHVRAGLTVVDNVADFLCLVATTPQAVGRAFNVEDDLPQTWADYFQDLARLLQAPAPRSVPRPLAYLAARVSEGLVRQLSPGRRPPVTREALNLIAWPNRFPTAAARGLGWQPRVSYAQALKAIEADVRARGL